MAGLIISSLPEIHLPKVIQSLFIIEFNFKALEGYIYRYNITISVKLYINNIEWMCILVVSDNCMLSLVHLLIYLCTYNSHGSSDAKSRHSFFATQLFLCTWLFLLMFFVCIRKKKLHFIFLDKKIDIIAIVWYRNIWPISSSISRVGLN